MKKVKKKRKMISIINILYEPYKLLTYYIRLKSTNLPKCFQYSKSNLLVI